MCEECVWGTHCPYKYFHQLLVPDTDYLHTSVTAYCRLLLPETTPHTFSTIPTLPSSWILIMVAEDS